MRTRQFFTLALALIAFAGCKNDSAENAPNTSGEAKVKESFEARVKREIEAKLQLPATEKYTYAIHREFISSDTIQDAIITVNRMAFAIDESIRTNSTAKAVEMGYMGNYNFFFYYDGAKDRFSVPIPVPSSPGRPLDVSFESIVSPARKDVMIDYRIRNSGSRAYFTVLNESDLLLIFRWNRFDHAGESKPTALLHSLEESPNGGAKDIVIYESELDNNAEVTKDVYQFEPVITKKGKLVQHFIYEPRAAKYRLK